MIFELTFWQRRSDDDLDEDVDVEPCPFEFKETGEIRDADADRENRDAPWWDSKTVATVEAEDVETAWRLVEQNLTVVKRLAAFSRTS
jgi:hypothetical protein